jgi:WD40 repeat protein
MFTCQYYCEQVYKNQKLTFELKGHSKRIASVALSNDRTFAVTGSWDYTVRIWPIILLAKVSELARKGKRQKVENK